MAAIDFPTSPSVGDTHSVGNVSYRWNGASWESIGAPVDSVVNATGITTGDLIYYNSGSFLSTSNATVAKLNLGNFVMNTDQTVGAGQDNYVLTYDHSTTEIGLEVLPTTAITALNSATANELVTVGSTTTELDAEANLTFDGSTLAVSGDITATGTVLVTGDTAAGDDAAIGYTAAEGLILTGQGSAADITIKNDADAEVLKVPTGTVNIETGGTITTVGDIIADGNGVAGGITLSDGIVSIRTGTGSVAAIDLYCEVGNAHKVTIQSPAHADFSGNVSLTLPTTTGTITSTGKQTMWIPAAAMYPREDSGCAALAKVDLGTNVPDLNILDFDPSSDEFAEFSVAPPKAWNDGTVTFQAYFTVAGTNTGTVKWELEGVGYGDNDQLTGTTYGSPIGPAAKAHSGTADDLNITAESGAVTIANAASGDLVYFRISRDISDDTQTGDARLIGIKLFFTTDKANDE